MIADPNLWLFGPLLKPMPGKVPELEAMTRVTLAQTMLRAGVKHYYPVTDSYYRCSFTPLAKTDFPRIHGIDERIAIKDYAANIHFYYHVIRGAATGSKHD